ncbi:MULTISPECIES: metallophosphoesterase [Cryobacterium]|uniref:Metallophosphatase n=1 Tax=Cryobacterium zongtaii TaxID=1259217 RepID=A0A2S3Z6S2_9MICO|nr:MULTISPECIES: metallophosphoesterase [Cryobacterium]MEC5183023.1 putative MPP superfamily phosphohydrolase [Cryobacterium sp. MP_3.1]POH60846.1 metallophosphatase [Cryobacterium zongtaii]POH69219.1 metallophosphatase [Cryobacterium zongtaii]TFC41076.1 metallophosphoesterase [Cryobacterium sp. TMN-39-2]TFC61626.1 metallophosphoesterase [Cryobacterium sp. TMB1-7]
MSAARAIVASAAAVTTAGLAAFAWGSLVERRRFTLREVTVPVLAPGSDPITVLHLSDLHMAPWQRDKQDWVRGLAALKPDLVVNTGDNLGHEDGIAGVEYALEPFKGIPGIFVNGSNDFFGPQPKNPLKYFGGPSMLRSRHVELDTDDLHRVFADLGWTDLNNAAEALDINGTHLEIFGVDDPHIRRDRLDLITGAIDEMRGNDPLTEETWPDPEEPAGRRSTLTVGVVHAPYQRVLNSFINHGAQLMLAGHTHGGQVCVPKFGALVTNCDIPRRQVKGLSLWSVGLRTAYLNVSAGLGTSIYAPVRFACPPEATLLTLTAA